MSDKPAVKFKKRWMIPFGMLFFLVALGLLRLLTTAGPAVGPQTAITISEETTRITGPLDVRGYVDYLQAINDQLAAGATPENNFEVVLRRVVGPHEIRPEHRAEYHRLMGIDELPVDGDYLLDYQDFVVLEENPDLNRAMIWSEKEFSRPGEELLNETDRLVSAPWGAEDNPRAVRWLEEIDDKLDAIVEGSRRPKYYSPYLPAVAKTPPEGPRLLDVLLPSAAVQRSVAEALLARAMFRIQQGELDTAWSDLQAIHRMARYVDQGGYTIIEGLVGIAMDASAWKGECSIIASNRLTAEEARGYLGDLMTLKPVGSTADKIDFGERYAGLDAVQEIAEHGVDEIHRWFFGYGMLMPGGSTPPPSILQGVGNFVANGKAAGADWNVAMKRANERYDQLVEVAREPDPAKQSAEFRRLEAERGAILRRNRFLGTVILSGTTSRTLGESAGEVVSAYLSPAIATSVLADRISASRLETIRTAFALRLYRFEHSEFPESLAVLLPKYLPEVPLDAVTGRPLLYRRTDDGCVVYGVGRNRTDDGGFGPEDKLELIPRPDDVVVRVPN